VGAISKYGQNLVGKHGIHIYRCLSVWRDNGYCNFFNHLVVYKIISLNRRKFDGCLVAKCNTVYSSWNDLTLQSKAHVIIFVENSTVDNAMIIIDDCENLLRFFKLFPDLKYGIP